MSVTSYLAALELGMHQLEIVERINVAPWALNTLRINWPGRVVPRCLILQGQGIFAFRAKLDYRLFRIDFSTPNHRHVLRFVGNNTSWVRPSLLIDVKSFDNMSFDVIATLRCAVEP